MWLSLAPAASSGGAEDLITTVPTLMPVDGASGNISSDLYQDTIIIKNDKCY